MKYTIYMSKCKLVGSIDSFIYKAELILPIVHIELSPIYNKMCAFSCYF